MALAITELLRVLPTISLKLGGVTPPPPPARYAPAHALRRTKIMQFGHKHAHEHITGCWQGRRNWGGAGGAASPLAFC
jgi:hypothetical protein